EDLNWVIVHKTEIKDKIPNPCWAPIEIPLSKLCNGDLNRELKFDLIKISSDGSQKILGTAASSVNLLRSNFEKRQDSVILNLKDVDKETPKLMIDQLHIVPGPYSFLDYIRSGVQISVTMAIDFTQSNGMPSNPNSLHYIDRSGRFNQYQIAIKSIGDIIAPYDHDQLFPVYGFGARVGGSVSHCFPLNMNYNQPEVQGVNGILEAYANAINTIELYGPTNFSPTLNEVVQKVNRSDMRSNYEILVILTDGVISDMELTVMAIVDASTLPLSIIIVGIGNADFSNMERLDGDDKRLSYFNKVASRDIVQFVPMRDFMHGATHYLLPKAVLEEVPDQLKSYMSTNCIDISLPPVYS
ncbi:Copine-domain-containing protein, partial [Neoconidiobolus thromboides FSU 785]